MAGLSSAKNTEFLVQQAFIEAKFLNIFTTLMGTILSVDTIKSIATVSIYNKITTQDQYGSTSSISLGTVTTKYSTLSLYKYTPSIGDLVKIEISSSDIQGFLNHDNKSYGPAKFNIYDSIITPISLGYNDSDNITAGILIKGFKINCSSFEVNNNTYSLIPALITFLNALATTVPVPGTPLDASSGGAISAASTALQTFLPALLQKKQEEGLCSTQVILKPIMNQESTKELKSMSLMEKLKHVINWSWFVKK